MIGQVLQQVLNRIPAPAIFPFHLLVISRLDLEEQFLGRARLEKIIVGPQSDDFQGGVSAEVQPILLW
jgi:hypothetical protein